MNRSQQVKPTRRSFLAISASVTAQAAVLRLTGDSERQWKNRDCRSLQMSPALGLSHDGAG